MSKLIKITLKWTRVGKTHALKAGRFTLDDAKALALLQGVAIKDTPAILVANKLDALVRRQDVLPWLRQMQERHAFAEFVPMSATREADVERLLGIVEPYLPHGFRNRLQRPGTLDPGAIPMPSPADVQKALPDAVKPPQ